MVYSVWCIVRCHHEYIYFYRTLDSNKVLVTVPGGSKYETVTVASVSRGLKGCLTDRDLLLFVAVQCAATDLRSTNSGLRSNELVI